MMELVRSICRFGLNLLHYRAPTREIKTVESDEKFIRLLKICVRR